MSFIKNQANCFNLEQTGLPARLAGATAKRAGQAGWKYHNNNIIRKKAMEQEFSWSGLLISLSIAFFIVIISASALNFINHSVAAGSDGRKSIGTVAYQ